MSLDKDLADLTIEMINNDAELVTMMNTIADSEIAWSMCIRLVAATHTLVKAFDVRDIDAAHKLLREVATQFKSNLALFYIYGKRQTVADQATTAAVN